MLWGLTRVVKVAARHGFVLSNILDAELSNNNASMSMNESESTPMRLWVTVELPGEETSSDPPYSDTPENCG